MKVRCTTCRGRGQVFKLGGYTKSDLQPCLKCKGSGETKPSERKKQRSFSRGRHTFRNEGMDQLDQVEAV